jgi:hypothetical protein
VDIYIPSLSLAFEFQGEQHYSEAYKKHGNLNENRSFFSNFEQRLKKDEEKRETCKRLGITLIEVPFWWDRKIDTLKTMIVNYRPDIAKQIKE